MKKPTFCHRLIFCTKASFCMWAIGFFISLFFGFWHDILLCSVAGFPLSTVAGVAGTYIPDILESKNAIKNMSYRK